MGESKSAVVSLPEVFGPDLLTEGMCGQLRAIVEALVESELDSALKDWRGDGRVWVKRGAKGGNVRYLNLSNDRQRQALEFARKLASGDSGLIPRECPTYEKWRQYVYDELRAAGMGKQFDATFQDLRRTFIVERMDYLIRERQLSHDAAARIVAREVGHHRTEVLQWYLAPD